MSAQSSFATLIPVNYDAQTLNSKSIQSMRSGDDKYHLQFVKQNPIPALSAEDTVSSKSLEDSSTEYDSVSSSDSELIKGHFTLSFHQDKLPAKPHLGWRVGKGTSRFDDRNVDFLLAAPRDPKSKHLASVHMFFQFSWSSGMLMLIAASKERSVHYCLDGEWMELKHPSKRVLCHKSNRLRLDKFEYELVYRIPLDRKIEFYAERDAYLRSLSDWPLPKNNQWLAAMENGFTKQGRMLIFQSIGFGAFGWVWEGVDSTTGDLVAIKALYLKKKGDRALLEKELDMGLEFRALPGLLPIFHSWCEHNEPRPCGRVPEQIYFSSPLAQGDFYNYDWKNTSLETKLRLFRTTLLGLQALHDRGIMHRDISRKNMLVLSIDPPDAVLCDYGKATKEVTSNFTCIGPVRTVAPEVWKTTYTKKIDIWSWAYAMAEILGYKCYTDEQIHPRRLGLIHEFLDSDEADTACGWDFASLLRKMLTWNPMHRPSVEEVLEHSCWDLIREMQKPVANYEKTTHLKRIKISEEQQELGEVGRPPSKLKQEPRQAYQSPSATQTSFLQDVETQQILPFPTLAENGSTQPFSSYPKPP